MSKLTCVEDDIEEISLKYHKISQKPIDRSFVSRDFLRLANKFVLSEGEGRNERDLCFGIKEVTPELIVNVLNEMSKHLEPKKERQKLITVEKLGEEVRNLAEHGSFGRFLSSFYTEESNVVKALKCCSQTYIVLFLGSLGVHLYNTCRLRAKDIRGRWNLIIGRDSKTGIISVTHRRTEQAVRQTGSNKLEDTFQFTWEVTMTYSSDMSHFTSIRARVINIDWGGPVRDEEIEQIFLSVFSNPKVEDLTLEKLTISVDELRKGKANLGNFIRFIPRHILVRRVLPFLHPRELLMNVALVNSSFHDFSTSDELWNMIINESCRMMKFDLKSPMKRRVYMYYKDLRTYWRLEEPEKGTLEKKYYSLGKNGMFLTSEKKKKVKKIDKKKLKPILTSQRINTNLPQLFRVHFKTAVTGGCGVCICREIDGMDILDYHADGSISRADLRVVVDNRIQEVEKKVKEVVEKKRVRVMLPLEKDFVFNVFVDCEELKIHFFFNEDFSEKITCSVQRELLEEQKLRFGVKVNLGQEIEVLPSLPFLEFPYPTRKKIKRMY